MDKCLSDGIRKVLTEQERQYMRTWAYKIAPWKRDYANRYLLHLAVLKDEDSTLEGLVESTLSFEQYKPGDADQKLPEYFANVRDNSVHAYYISSHSLDEFKKMKLYKISGIDAGFAIKSDGDIVTVHNNSSRRGLVKPMLEKAIDEGGVTLDHFDGKFS